MNNHNATILRIIKPYKDFSETINQHEIAERFMIIRNEEISPRRVRRIIESLIEQGEPIISTPHQPGGYCYGGRENEAIECYKRLRRKGIRVLLRARRILRNERNRKGQLEMFEEVSYGSK